MIIILSLYEPRKPTTNLLIRRFFGTSAEHFFAYLAEKFSNPLLILSNKNILYPTFMQSYYKMSNKINVFQAINDITDRIFWGNAGSVI